MYQYKNKFLKKYNSEEDYINNKYNETPNISFYKKNEVNNVIYSHYINNITQCLYKINDKGEKVFNGRILWENGTYRFCGPYDIGNLGNIREKLNFDFLDEKNNFNDPILGYRPIGIRITDNIDSINTYMGLKYLSDNIKGSLIKKYVTFSNANIFVNRYKTHSTNIGEYNIPKWRLPSETDLQKMSSLYTGAYENDNDSIEYILKNLNKLYPDYSIPCFEDDDYIISNIEGMGFETLLLNTCIHQLSDISNKKNMIAIPFIDI